MENEQRLLDFLNDDDTSHDVVTKGELGGEVSLRLDRERELVQLNDGKLLPRMLQLTLSGVLSRQLDVIKEGRTVVDRVDYAAAKKQQQVSGCRPTPTCARARRARRRRRHFRSRSTCSPPRARR